MAATPLVRARTVRRVRDWQSAADFSEGQIYDRCVSTAWGSREAVYGSRMRDTAPSLNGTSLVANLVDQSGLSGTINRLLYADQTSYLPGDLLVKIDRMTMAHSLEGRSPLLDHEVVAFAAQLPQSVKFRHNCTKHLLKKLLGRSFPAPFVHRRKMGFGVPLADWFRTDLRPLLQVRIAESALCESDLLRREPVETLFVQHQTGRYDHANCLWSFLVLEEWYRQFVEAGVAA
jgi:asparagine synthase (glutamine-hydrolysing)